MIGSMYRVQFNAAKSTHLVSIWFKTYPSACYTLATFKSTYNIGYNGPMQRIFGSASFCSNNIWVHIEILKP